MARRKVKITRDLVLFSTGLMGYAHELLLRDDVREGILVIVGGMMGLPAFIHIDEVRQAKKAEKPTDEDNEPSPIGG